MSNLILSCVAWRLRNCIIIAVVVGFSHWKSISPSLKYWFKDLHFITSLSCYHYTMLVELLVGLAVADFVWKICRHYSSAKSSELEVWYESGWEFQFKVNDDRKRFGFCASVGLSFETIIQNPIISEGGSCTNVVNNTFLSCRPDQGNVVANLV